MAEEAAWTAAGCFGMRLRKSVESVVAGTAEPQRCGRHVLLGGLGRLGWLATEFLIHRQAEQIVLASAGGCGLVGGGGERAPRLQALGGRVQVVSCHESDPSETRALIGNQHPITTLVHV